MCLFAKERLGNAEEAGSVQDDLFQEPWGIFRPGFVSGVSDAVYNI